MPIVCYIYYGTVCVDLSISSQNTRLFVFSQPPVEGQQITLEATGKQVVLTNVNHYRMTIDAVPVESLVSTG